MPKSTDVMPWEIHRLDRDPSGFFRIMDEGQDIAGVRGLDHAQLIAQAPALVAGLRQIEGMALDGLEGFRRKDIAEVARGLFRQATSPQK
jgi:hypothetical protein